MDKRPVREKKNIRFKNYQDLPFGRDNFSLCTDPPPRPPLRINRLFLREWGGGGGGGGGGGLYIG